MNKLLTFLTVLAFATVATAQVAMKVEHAADLPWNPLFSGTSATFYSTRFCDADTGYVAGEGGLILKTTNGGASWSQLFTGTSMPLMSICFTDVMHGFAAGIDPFSVYEGFILKTVDGGTTWTTPLASGSRYGLYDICFPVPDTGYAVGMFGTILKSTNSGATWSLLPVTTSSDLSGVFFTSANTGYAAGDMGTILKTTNGGQSWVKLTTGTTNGLLSLYFTNATTGYASGVFGTVIKTVNAGLTWSLLQKVTDNHLWSVCFVNPTTGFTAGSGGTILKTSDAGVSWVSSPSGTTNDLESLSFADATVGYVCGNSGIILKTTNGGFVGIHETLHPAGRLKLFPNPTTGRFTIESSGITGTADLTVADIHGKEIFRQWIGNSGTPIDISSLSAGVYFIRLRTHDQVEFGKIVKQ